MNTAIPFWRAVREKGEAIQSEIERRITLSAIEGNDGPMEGQPKHGGVYGVSIANPLRGMVGGRVCMMTVPNAALRTVEGSHALASREQIEQHLAGEAERGRELAAMERAAQLRRGGFDAQ